MLNVLREEATNYTRVPEEMKHALQITLYCFSCILQFSCFLSLQQDLGRVLNDLAVDIGSDSSFPFENN